MPGVRSICLSGDLGKGLLSRASVLLPVCPLVILSSLIPFPGDVGLPAKLNRVCLGQAMVLATCSSGALSALELFCQISPDSHPNQQPSEASWLEVPLL